MKCANKSSVESAPLTGEWVNKGLPGWTCTNCGEHIVLDIFRWGKYCPNCGAKMSIKVSTITNFYEETARKVGEAIEFKVDSSK